MHAWEVHKYLQWIYLAGKLSPPLVCMPHTLEEPAIHTPSLLYHIIKHYRVPPFARGYHCMTVGREAVSLAHTWRKVPLVSREIHSQIQDSDQICSQDTTISKCIKSNNKAQQRPTLCKYSSRHKDSSSLTTLFGCTLERNVTNNSQLATCITRTRVNLLGHHLCSPPKGSQLSRSIRKKHFITMRTPQRLDQQSSWKPDSREHQSYFQCSHRIPNKGGTIINVRYLHRYQLLVVE